MTDGSSMLYCWTKRTLDVLFSLVILIAGLPLWALICLWIKLDSRGPIFYKPMVLGKDAHLFCLYKFRTMLPGSDGSSHQKAVVENLRRGRAPGVDKRGQPIFKTAICEPAQITQAGRFLRRLSLDEVPQFWNVLRGDMSLVGPRPALVFEAELYNEQQRKRFAVLPGITGLYQVTRRNRASIEQMINIDLEYVSARSIWMDLAIMVKTPFAMLQGQ